MKLKPTILTHPQLPKSLHGINPRTIEGNKWWNLKRQEVYASTDYHCIACGISKYEAKAKKWLEAHENWEINYETGECLVTDIYPLCHYCHNFIHTGRLSQLLINEKKISENYVRNVLEHGFEILSINKLKCYPEKLLLANYVKANTFGVEAYEIKTDLKDTDFYLLWNGKKYKNELTTKETII